MSLNISVMVNNGKTSANEDDFDKRPRTFAPPLVIQLVPRFVLLSIAAMTDLTLLRAVLYTCTILFNISTTSKHDGRIMSFWPKWKWKCMANGYWPKTTFTQGDCSRCRCRVRTGVLPCQYVLPRWCFANLIVTTQEQRV